MHIVFCTDNNYVMPCGITIISLLENNKKSNIDIHILGLDLNNQSKKDLISISDKYSLARIKIHNITKDSLQKYNFPINKGSYINITTYLRFFIADLLPELDKIIYLDCDLLVLNDISKFWNIDIDNCSVAGVIDAPAFDKNTYRLLKYDNTYSYINAGVLLINLKYWREHDIHRNLLEYLKDNYNNIQRGDQDIINGTLYKSIKTIPLRYNMHNFFFHRNSNAHQFQTEMIEVRKSPAIIHFTFSMKPWLKGCIHPFAKDYIKYKNLTQWKDTPLTWGTLDFKRKLRYYKRILFDKLRLKKSSYLKKQEF